MKDRYQIRRNDNNLYYFTRTNKKDAKEILERVQKVTGIEHYIFDTKKQERI